nr:MAG TPA: hypothetical protein [Caudoviricetes sp.]
MDYLIKIIASLYRDHIMRMYFKRDGRVLLNSRKKQPL